jgi:hypothetical protein
MIINWISRRQNGITNLFNWTSRFLKFTPPPLIPGDGVSVSINTRDISTFSSRDVVKINEREVVYGNGD